MPFDSTQLALACAGFTIGCCVAQADVLCVKPGGGDGCEATITAALTAAAPGDLVRVATGSYAENVTVSANLTLEGGWNLTFTARDPASFVTTITPADQTQSVVAIVGSFANPASSTPVLDGFTITGGRADLGSNHGGGLRIGDSHATVRNCAIVDNRAFLLGGGVWVQRGAPRLEGNRIERNEVIDGSAVGGGVMLENPSRAVLVGNLIADNVVREPGSLGGGVGLQSGRAELVDNVIMDNTVSSVGSQGRGGGIGVEFAAEIVVRGGSLSGNTSGMGCQGFGGGMFITNTAAATVENVQFTDNCSQFGGGGIYTFATAKYLVAGALFAANDGGGNGQAILDDDADSAVVLRNNTLAGTGSGTGAALPADLVLVNNIVTGYATGVSAPAVTLDEANVFWNNTANTLGFALDPDSNLFVDPLLDTNAHLMAGSPAIDAGVATAGPFADIDGEPRPADGGSGLYRFDIGADEAPGEGPDVADLDRGVADLIINGTGNPGGNQNTDWIGYAVMGRDVNGDGLDDLVIAAQDWAQDFDNDVFANGHAFGLFHFGERRTGTINLVSEPADLELVSLLTNWHFGEGFANADVNDDGMRDLLVVAGVQDDGDANIVPAVIVFAGGPGLAGAIGVDDQAPGLYAMLGQSGNGGALGGWHGNGLATGDLDGDGVADIAAGEPGAQTPNARAAGSPPGVVHVTFGGAGLAGVLDLAAAPADFTLVGDDHDNPLRAVAVGRLDHGPQVDLVARTAVSAHVLFGPLAAGVQDLSSTPADVIISGLGDPGLFFDQVLIGDATGDGWNDLLLSWGDGLSADRIVVFAGPFAAGQRLDAATDAAFVLVAEEEISALAFGDVLGDARADLVIGLRNAQRAYVVSPAAAVSGEIQVQEIASMRVVGTTQRQLGWDASVGDLDGDSRGDLIVGTWQLVDPGLSTDANETDIGRAFVLYGGGAPDNCPGLSNPDQADADGDAVGDACDNCRLLANGNQRDTNGDGLGNICDPDLNNDGNVNFFDLGIIKKHFFSDDPDADLNGDGAVNFADLGVMKAFFFGPPGPGAGE